MKLGGNVREPPGAPDLTKYHLVDMFTSRTHPSVREEIVKAYMSLSSPLLIPTKAFGVGVNPPNVHFVFFKKGLNRNAESAVIKYCEICQRDLLFSDFDEFKQPIKCRLYWL